MRVFRTSNDSRDPAVVDDGLDEISLFLAAVAARTRLHFRRVEYQHRFADHALRDEHARACDDVAAALTQSELQQLRALERDYVASTVDDFADPCARSLVSERQVA